MPSPRHLTVIEELWTSHRAFRVAFVLVFVSAITVAAIYSVYRLYHMECL